jgi:hypothetical protein
MAVEGCLDRGGFLKEFRSFSRRLWRSVFRNAYIQIIREMTVAWAFDTLGYSKRLREAGVPVPQAEAHAEATREFVMTELVTKQDLQAAIETQTLRLTVRLGGIVAAGVAVAIGILGLLLRLH